MKRHGWTAADLSESVTTEARADTLSRAVEDHWRDIGQRATTTPAVREALERELAEARKEVSRRRDSEVRARLDGRVARLAAALGVECAGGAT